MKKRFIGVALAYALTTGVMTNTLAADPATISVSQATGTNRQNTQVVSAQLLALWSDPSGQIMLAGGVEGTLLRSTDAGLTWRQTLADDSSKINSFESDGASILVAVADDHLLRSTDQGVTWSRLTLPAEQNISRVIHHRKSRSWIALSGGDVLRSTDDCMTWSRVYTGAPQTPLFNIIVTAQGALLAGGAHGALLRSSDGLQWVTLPTKSDMSIVRFLALPGRAGILAFGVDGAILGLHTDGTVQWQGKIGIPDVLSAATVDTFRHQVLVGNSSGQVWRSRDNGHTWKGATAVPTAYVNGLYVDPRTGEITMAGARASIARSSDGGASWDFLHGNAWTTRINSMLVDPSGNTMLIVGTGGTVWRSGDRGHNWSEVRPDLSRYVSEIMTLPDSKALLAIGFDGLVMHSIDAGLNWTIRNSGMPAPVSLQSLIREPRSGALLASGPMGSILRSSTTGLSWEAIQPVPDAGDGFFKQLVSDPDSGTTIAIGSPGKVMRSTDTGLHWEASDLDASDGGIAQGTVVAKGIFVVARLDGGILRSTDGGVHWQTVTKVSGGLSALHADPESGKVWVMGSGAMYGSSDAGASWQAVQLPEKLSLNFMTRTAAKTLLGFGDRGAILRSTDNGASWQRIPAVNASSLRKPLIDPKNNDIYVPGRDGTLLRSADDGQHWTIIPTHTSGHLNRLAIDQANRVLIATGERIVRIPLQ